MNLSKSAKYGFYRHCMCNFAPLALHAPIASPPTKECRLSFQI